MKKLISIGVALALLTMVVVPTVVAADYPDDPGSYSKTPFGVLGTGVELIGEIVDNIPYVSDMLAEYVDVPVVTELIGTYVGENFAWLTDLTAWTMLTVGDVVYALEPLLETLGAEEYAGPVEDVFYVLGGRMLDVWDAIGTSGVADLPGPGLGLPIGS